MRENNSIMSSNDQHVIPVYLTVHYGEKGGKKLYAHSAQAIEDAGGKWLSSWRSLAGAFRYRQPRETGEAA